jgi:hypothetical protein
MRIKRFTASQTLYFLECVAGQMAYASSQDSLHSRLAATMLSRHIDGTPFSIVLIAISAVCFSAKR